MRKRNSKSLSDRNLVEAKFSVASTDEIASVPGNVVTVSADFCREYWDRAFLMNHFQFSSSSITDSGRYKRILRMHFNDFSNIVESFAVDGNTKRVE